MTEKELCKMCNDYSDDCECENKESCKLLSIVIDNKMLSKENRELKKQIQDLKLKMSYMIDPNCIGDRNGEMGW